jgi:hypothetical protein
MLVSGMIIGTLFTLFVVPSIYMLLARTRSAEVAAEVDMPIDATPDLAPSMSMSAPASHS